MKILNGSGSEVEVDPLLMAMIKILLDSQEQILDSTHGWVELHYRADNGKVHGKLMQHIGLEKFYRPERFDQAKRRDQ